MTVKTSSKPINKRREARLKAGFTPEQVAKRLNRCVAYYRQLESRGHASYGLALRISSILNCRIDYWIYYP